MEKHVENSLPAHLPGPPLFFLRHSTSSAQYLLIEYGESIVDFGLVLYENSVIEL